MIYLALSESLADKIKNILEGYKIKYRIIEDGETLLKLSKKEKPDLIILEKDLPLLDGYAVTLVLKSNEKTKRIPILSIFKCSYKEEEIKAKECGVDEIIVCPFDNEELKQKIEKLIKLGGD